MLSVYLSFEYIIIIEYKIISVILKLDATPSEMYF